MFPCCRVDEYYVEDVPIYGNLENIIPGKFYFSIIKHVKRKLLNSTNNLRYLFLKTISVRYPKSHSYLYLVYYIGYT